MMDLISRLTIYISPTKNKKCTPTQIIYYHIALSLHKTLNFDECNLSFELITVLEQLVCTRRQVLFQIFRNSNYKIGFNIAANRFFYLNNKIGLEPLNLNFVKFKKVVKILFLKYGKTQSTQIIEINCNLRCPVSDSLLHRPFGQDIEQL